MAEPAAASDHPASQRGIWVGSIVIDCTNFGEMLAFWSEALHYSPGEPPKSDWVVLSDPRRIGPNVSLSKTQEGPLNDYRLHLDLYASDPLAEVERLIGLGAKMVRPPDAGHDFATLADPDGNLFDVIDINWPADSTGWWFGRRP